MRMKSTDRWHCTDPLCGCEVLVDRGGGIEGNNPVCSCGASMKKRYVPPALTYLEFLRLEEPAKATASEE